MRRKLFFVGVAILVIAGAAWWVLSNREPAEKTPRTSDSSSEQTSETTPVSNGFDKTLHSTDDPNSIWIIANKQRPLPGSYSPSDLGVPDVRLRLGRGEEQMQIRDLIAGEVKTMFDAALADGVTLVFGSGYRSYRLQKQFYDSYVARDGQAAADRYSARPGTSEHQTGLAFDVTNTAQSCHLEICFKDTPEGQWVAAHAHEYGFIIRYLDGKEASTGYQYEPWHLRYVGRELAAELHRTNQTLEEFFEIRS